MATTKSMSFKGGAIAGDPTPIPEPADALFIVRYDETPASDIDDAIHERKVPYLIYNNKVVELFYASTNSFTFRTTHVRNVDGENILDIVDYKVTGSSWSTSTKEISNGYESQAYLKKVSSPAIFDTTGQSGMKTVASVSDVPTDGIYQVSVMLTVTPKTASPTKSDLVFGFYGSAGVGLPDHTFHAVVDDSQTFGQQLSFSTTLNLKAGTNTLKMACGGLNTEYLVFVDDLTVAQLVNGVYHNGDDFEDVHTLPEIPDFNNDDGVLVDGATGGPRFMLWQTLANKVLGFIKSLSTTITAFRTGDVIPVDGPSGTAKMGKDDLLKEMAENALAGNVVQGFNPTRTSENPYNPGEPVAYNGKTYIFKTSHYGAWNAGDVIAFSTNNLYALKSRATTNPRFYWIKELSLPSTISASSVGGIRAWCAYPNSDNTAWTTGIQIISNGSYIIFYRDFDNQADALAFATPLYEINNSNGHLLAIVDWNGMGGPGHKFEMNGAMLTPECDNVAFMPILHGYVIENEIELENTDDKEKIKVYHVNLSSGIPATSTNRASSGYIRTYKNSKIVFKNLHNVYVGFQIYYYDTLGRYVKNDTTHWTNETIDPNNSFILNCVEDGFVRLLFRVRYDNTITDAIVTKLEDGLRAIIKDKVWQNGKKNSFDIFTDVISDTYYSQFADKVNNAATRKIFALQTDTHYSNFNGYSTYTQLRQMRKALKLAPVPTVANLGDLCNGWSPKPSHCSDVMHAVWDYSRFGNAYIQLVGNHDDDSWWEHEHGANKPAGVITPEEWHDMVFSKTKDYGVYMPYGRRYGSYDDAVNKIRYIFLDTLDVDYTLLNADGTLKYYGQWKSAIRQEQLDFLCQALLSRRDYYIVILSHHPLHSTGGVVNSDLVRGILEAYKNKTTYTGTSTITDFEASVSVDFTGDGTLVNAKLVGCFNGHTHADAIVTENGINYVGTTCAFVPDNSQDRSSSDETMNAFDVVAITSKTCYLYRFGYGSDRSFVFG